MDITDALPEHLGITSSVKDGCSKTGEVNSVLTISNKVCKGCQKTSPATNFRHNRLTCHDCEKKYGREYRQSEKGKLNAKCWTEDNREKMTELQAKWFQDNKEYVRDKNRERTKTDARYKFITNQRRRISLALEKKQKRTIEYLGCTSEEFFQWMSNQLTDEFTLDNHGDKWHIDHVIPISKFNLENEHEVSLGLNWRNTRPMSAHENLKKNNKILPEQIEQHVEKLVSYHREKNIVLPKEFIDLFAKHLVDGNPLKQSLPLQFGNILEEHG